MFKLSKRSLDRLDGLDERLVSVVTSAIHRSKIDFGVICGMRTLEEQQMLWQKLLVKLMFLYAGVQRGQFQTLRSSTVAQWKTL